MEQRWDSIRHFLHDKNKILITTHLNPDGDAIGSELALAFYLQDMGKSVRIVNADPLPPFLEFLTHNVPIERFAKTVHPAVITSCHGCFIVDVNEWKRLGDIGPTLQQAAIPIACIDHHLPNGQLGTTQVVDESASSTGELIYDFLTSENANLTQEILDALYTCIITDTGSFKFSNTRPKTHRIAADLIDRGAKFQKIYAELYESDTKSRTLLKGHLLANMQFERNDRLVWFVLSQELLKNLDAKIWEAEGFSDLPRTIKGVEISIMFSEDEDGLAKASFRSKGNIPIHELAEQFGGGGHRYAAGAALPWSLDKAIDKVIDSAKIYLDHHSHLF